MAEELPVEVPEDVPIAVPGDAPMSAREAGRLLASFRKPKEPEPSPLVTEVAQAEAGEQPIEEAAPETDPGEQPVAEEPAEQLPPIDPPRSWTRDEKERFSSLPRETQEYLAQREQERETALRRGQNEAAEQRKAMEAQREQMEQARKHYEQAIFQANQLLQRQSGEFADIKTWDDVQKLANEDWPRYAKWDALYKQSQMVAQEAKAAEERRIQEYKSELNKWHAEQDAKFLDAVPEMQNPDTAAKITSGAKTLLTNHYGFSEQDLAMLWSGERSLNFHDERQQRIILDAYRYHQAKAAVPKAAVKQVPKVQRPGSPVQRVPDADAQERALYNRLDETRGTAALRLGAQLLANRRAAR